MCQFRSAASGSDLTHTALRETKTRQGRHQRREPEIEAQKSNARGAHEESHDLDPRDTDQHVAHGREPGDRGGREHPPLAVFGGIAHRQSVAMTWSTWASWM